MDIRGEIAEKCEPLEDLPPPLLRARRAFGVVGLGSPLLLLGLLPDGMFGLRQHLCIQGVSNLHVGRLLDRNKLMSNLHRVQAIRTYFE